jgi:hypothetical protein
MAGLTNHPPEADRNGSARGLFRRLIDLARRDERTVVGWLEDDVHHFGITIRHDDHEVRDVAVAAVRFPYTTCGGAGIPFSKIIGTSLLERVSDFGKSVDMRLQCTHLFDLAALLVGFAAKPGRHERYEAIVEDRSFVGFTPGGRRIMGKGQAWLCRNGAECLRWEIDGQAVTGPGPWAGWPLMEGFRQRSELLDVESAKLGFVLRRAVMVSNGRTAARYPLPRERGWSSVCHTFQPHVREFAERIEGLRKDYAHSNEDMLAHVDLTPSYGAA